MDGFRKRMVVCTPFGKFVNGPQKGAMTPARLQGIATRFRKYPRQVKAYLNGDHPEKRSDRPADGWFEDVEYTTSYPGYPEGALVAEIKAHGELARWLMEDLVRGASIATVDGKNPDGTDQGEVLDHVLISDDNFDKRVNIAATHAQGGEPVAYFFTALPEKEAAMAKEVKEYEEEITRLKDENSALKAAKSDEAITVKLKETETLLAEKVREVAELTASNENLRADVERFKSPKAIETLNLQLKQQERQLRAEKVRRLVRDGVSEGQFNRGMVGDPKSGYDHPSDEAVLVWFKGSMFKDSFENLDFALATFPKQRLNRQFGNGPDSDQTKATMTDQDKEFIRSQGKDPEKVAAAMKAKDATEYAALTAKAS